MIKIGSRSQVFPQVPHSLECVSPRASRLLRWRMLFYGVCLSANLFLTSHFASCRISSVWEIKNLDFRKSWHWFHLLLECWPCHWLALQTCIHVKCCAQDFSSVATCRDASPHTYTVIQDGASRPHAETCTQALRELQWVLGEYSRTRLVRTLSPLCWQDPYKTALLLLSCFSRVRLCNPLDGSPPGSPVPGILQARTLEWVAISFSNAGKWKVKVKSLSRVQLLVTPWTAAYQAPLSMGFSRQEYWSGVPSPSPYKTALLRAFQEDLVPRSTS